MKHGITCILCLHEIEYMRLCDIYGENRFKIMRRWCDDYDIQIDMELFNITVYDDRIALDCGGTIETLEISLLRGLHFTYIEHLKEE